MVEKFWDNGQLPLTKTADYTGTQGGTTPIYLTEGEFNTQFKERKNQFFLDKSRTYLDPKTAKDRYAVMEYVPDSNNLFLQEKIKSEVRSVLSDKIAEYRAEHNGKSPTGQELYELVFFAQEEAFSRNNISSIDPDESFLQAPHKDLMDVQAMISAKAIAAKAGLDAQGEQGIYCALLSYWNNL